MCVGYSATIIFLHVGELARLMPVLNCQAFWLITLILYFNVRFPLTYFCYVLIYFLYVYIQITTLIVRTSAAAHTQKYKNLHPWSTSWATSFINTFVVTLTFLQIYNDEFVVFHIIYLHSSKICVIFYIWIDCTEFYIGTNFSANMVKSE